MAWTARRLGRGVELAGLGALAALLAAACGGGKAPLDPGGIPPSSILVASAPEGFSAVHLGAPYDANFELLPGKAGRSLFPEAPVHRSAQHRLNTEIVQASDAEHLAAHASAWHLAGAHAALDHSKTYVSRRLVQVADVVELDETGGARGAPDGAVYYPSKVYLGWSYEVVCEVNKSALDAGFEANLLVAQGDIGAFSKQSNAQCQSLGFGVAFDNGKAVFAKKLEDVDARFHATAAVPVRVEWRRIPGRKGHTDAAPKSGCAGTSGCERCEAWEFVQVAWTIPRRDRSGASWDVDDSPPDVQLTVTAPGGVSLSSPEVQTYAFEWMLDAPLRLPADSKLTIVATDRDVTAHDPMATLVSEPLPAFLHESTWQLMGGQMALRGRCVAPE
jgi:hypothetical protein